MGDLPGVWRVICDAKRIMAEQGRNQWTDDYPSLAGIEADIRSGDAYVLVSGGGEVAAYAYVTMKPEPVYAAIVGRWLTAGPYAVVHRLAVGAAFRGRGLARRLMLHAEDIARQGGAGSIRVDTPGRAALAAYGWIQTMITPRCSVSCRLSAIAVAAR